MKKSFTSFVLFSLIGLSSVFAQIPTNGLVGYWPFNSNANDESGNSNNGSVTGATLTTDRFGNANSAYNFNGSNCNISVPTSTSLNNVSQGPLTMSCWVNSAVYTSEPILFYGTVNTSGGGYVYYFGQWAGQKYNFRNWNQNNGGEWDITAPNSYNFNQWYLLIITIDPTLNVSNFYIDGQLVGTSTNTVHTLPPPVQLYIGRSNSSNGIFNGKIDDVRIYNRVLSQSEITSIYNETPSACTQIITVTDTLIINANLTGYNPISYANTIKIFPNPTKDHIFIKSDNASTGFQVKIINTLSQIVYQTTINQTQYYIDLNTWSGNGTYFVQLLDTNGNLLEVRKIVLQ